VVIRSVNIWTILLFKCILFLKKPRQGTDVSATFMYAREIPSVRKAQSTLQFQWLRNNLSFTTLFTRHLTACQTIQGVSDIKVTAMWHSDRKQKTHKSKSEKGRHGHSVSVTVLLKCLKKRKWKQSLSLNVHIDINALCLPTDALIYQY